MIREAGARGSRLLVACLLCCVIGLLGAAAPVLGEGVSSGGGSDASPLGGALVVPGSPTEGQQARAAEEAKLSSPEAVTAREESRTKYENLDAEQVAKVAGETFPAVINELAGGPPKLPVGEAITAFPADDAAQVDLGGGKRGVIALTEPLAVETSAGQREPLDLGFAEVGGVFQPARSAVALRVPKRLADGVQLGGSGVSLTPVGGNGSVLGGSEGVVDGATVLYANTQTDADTVVKPLPLGFEEDTLLRSVDSPSTLSFRVGLPEGASLVGAKDGSGAARVMDEGAVVATVRAPSARDAEGTSVPVSMGVEGDVLSLTVDDLAGSWRYPIEVDPTVVDNGTAPTGLTWAFETNDGYCGDGYCASKNGTELQDSSSDGGNFYRGSWGVWGYETEGESHIYGFISETSSSGSYIENELGIVNPSRLEASASYPASYGNTRTELCSSSGCAPGSVTSENKSNVAYFKQVAIPGEGGSASFDAKATSTAVEILQEKGPFGGFNYTTSKFSGGYEQPETTNVLYANTWLAPLNRSQFEFEGGDPGIGIDKWTTKSTPSAPGWEADESESRTCVQCAEAWGAGYGGGLYSYSSRNGHSLPDGEDTVEVKLYNATGESSSAQAKVRVDGTPPHELTLTGLPPNKEIGNGVYRVKASAKDGSGSTPSSGVESIALEVDGRQIGSSVWSCSSGPCTATGEWVISGSEFAVGEHEVTVVATDKAKNVAEEKYTMFVARPTTPISMGPGSVDPQSGELRLSSTDVSVGAPGGSLSVSRSYGSLHLTAGAEGPLGPQWSLSLGGSQNLTKLPDGDMLLTDGTGLQAVFVSKGGGEFTAPKGDEGLVLNEKKVGETVEFTLKDDAGSATTFTPSSGVGAVWLPTIREQANGLDVSKITYQIAGSITEPTELLAPVPAGVSCSSELVKGCRALKFVYASKTTATGDSPSEWGDYEGHLKETTFTAWNPSSSKMVTETVAQYQYDKEGKLRAEWNPQVSPALETTYGYDAEGHVTSVSPAGQQPSLFAYGMIAGDPRTGRVLSMTRPGAATAIVKSAAPVNTSVPVLSTNEPVIGGTISVSTGAWSNSPLAYSYQWYSAGEPIMGATDQSYVPLAGERSSSLYAEVRATNADGMTSVVTAHTTKNVGVFVPKYLSQFGSKGEGNGQLSSPRGVAVDSKGHVWVVEQAQLSRSAVHLVGRICKSIRLER